MWQSAHARPFPSTPGGVRSKKATNPRSTEAQDSPPQALSAASPADGVPAMAREPARAIEMAIEIRTARAVLCIVLIVSPNRRNLHEALFARRPDLAATVDP